jgi:hypothetical protein
LSFAEHAAGLTLLVSLVVPPVAVRVALDASHGGLGSSELAARVLGIVGSVALTVILVIVAPVAGFRRRGLWPLLVPLYGEYYLIAIVWRCGAAMLRVAQQREQQRQRSVPANRAPTTLPEYP